MCGIAGVIGPLSQPEREEAVRAMVQRQRHRGPDDDGCVSRDEATLGVCRLAIFDPAHGHQPMVTPDGRYHIVFNGAIYNHRELRRSLECDGVAFRTTCDTEVLLAMFARHGEKCLSRLRGMFAFAVWDAKLRALFAARDAFGIKPLYYAERPRTGFVFASELNAILSSGLVSREIDPLAAADYLAWSCVPAPRTIYTGIKSLLPGHALWLDADGLATTRPWWRFPRAGNPIRDRREFTAELRLRLEDTIRAHQVADVPVGAFLSGGMDSGSVVGLMAKTGASRMKTFSIVFDEAEYSEDALARLSAQQSGTEHHECRVTGRQLAGEIESVLRAFDQPTGDGINTYYVSRAARESGVKVALSGLGGDELFGGYPSFHDLPKLAGLTKAWHLLPGIVRQPLLERLRAGEARRQKLADLLAYGCDLHALCSMRRLLFGQQRRLSLLSPAVRHAVEQRGPLHPCLPDMRTELAGADSFQIISAWELRTYMADMLLRDSDVFSLAHSLELRVPFVDREFIEWWWTQPLRNKFKRGAQKAALAEAVSDVLPEEVLRARKRGFAFPFPRWMKTDLRPFLEDLFQPSSVARAEWLDTKNVMHEWQNYLRGNDAGAWHRVWSLAILISFANRRAGTAEMRRPVPQLV